MAMCFFFCLFFVCVFLFFYYYFICLGVGGVEGGGNDVGI